MPRRLRHHRAGFTIIELLIVITIIAVLMTLTLRVVGAFITQAREAATRATIQKAERLLKSRMEAFHRLYGGTDPKALARLKSAPTIYGFSYWNNKTNFPGLTDAQCYILARKSLYRDMFPQQQGEARNAGTPTNPLYPGLNAATNNPTNADSSEVLYHFLTQANVLGDTPVGADAFATSELRDTDGDGLPEIVDAWGQPLRFYRWPTRLFRWNLANPVPFPLPVALPLPDVTYAKLIASTLPAVVDLQRDPDDPLRDVAAIQNFEQFFHTPATWHTPLIISAGPDGVLGLYEPDGPNASIVTYPSGPTFFPPPSATANWMNLAAIDPITPTAPPNTPPVTAMDPLSDNIATLNIRAGGK